jgi:hypothetical protein
LVIWYIFPRFGIFYQVKSGNPVAGSEKKFQKYFFAVFKKLPWMAEFKIWASTFRLSIKLKIMEKNWARNRHRPAPIHIFGQLHFCWAKLNHRTLSSTPPKFGNKCQRAGANFPAHMRISPRARATMPVYNFTNLQLLQISQIYTFTNLQLYKCIILQFSSFAQPQSKCLLLF